MEISELNYQTVKLVIYSCREKQFSQIRSLEVHCFQVSSFSPTGAHIIAQFSKKVLDEDISIFPGSEMFPAVKGAFTSVCRQIYGTCEGLQVLIPYSLHESIAKAWKKVSIFKLFFFSSNLYFKYGHYCNIILQLKYFTGANMTTLAPQQSRGHNAFLFGTT